MPAIQFLPGALDDLKRLRDFLVDTDVTAAEETVLLILDAVDVLCAHPLLGRASQDKLRELVISRGRTGYVALYKYDERKDRILIAAIRHQREAGYDPERR